MPIDRTTLDDCVRKNRNRERPVKRSPKAGSLKPSLVEAHIDLRALLVRADPVKVVVDTRSCKVTVLTTFVVSPVNHALVVKLNLVDRGFTRVFAERAGHALGC